MRVYHSYQRSPWPNDLSWGDPHMGLALLDREANCAEIFIQAQMKFWVGLAAVVKE